MTNVLETFAEKLLDFQDQFLADKSEGTSWYLGDSFTEARRLTHNTFVSFIANSQNPMLNTPLQQETAIYVATQGETVPESKVVYRLVVEGLTLDCIQKKYLSDLEVFKAYGLSETSAAAFANIFEQHLDKLFQIGWL